MDIKDFILIAGGTLIALVVAHGFWVAYRAKKEPLRMDIVPDLIPDDVDDMERLRGELPNGGARIIQKKLPPSQGDLELDLPLLHDEATDEPPAKVVQPPPYKPTVHQAPPRRLDRGEPFVGEVAEDPTTFDKPAEASAKAGQRDIDLDRVPEPTTAETDATLAQSEAGPISSRVAEVQLDLVPANDSEPVTPKTDSPKSHASSKNASSKNASSKHIRQKGSATRAQDDVPALNREVEELLVVHLVAPKGQPFGGEALVNALRSQGLRFGEMGIFHRVNPATKVKQFSVANIVEPGTFDMADLDALETMGMSFFLQLPGPESAMDAFEDMLMTVRNVNVELGGEVRDENLSMLTRQGAEHMRQRISDFARKRLSKRVS